ncbi:F0F1 ATP synthase subunit gamma [Candidatus Liberibacter solanacearum CLso-ZC1]|uniref:ATP synthase gamma chain n=1 Tax=Liberibacter solanacearum (strain CLso-ZC1) TaxID=658172 RepID=E4UBS7_LIBSC|nr:F0F1 ATP synthase subunit gamma [Candidatus Liberibacter solanacearum]ADR51817.1 F0F1 ATP synthase subunit gamma [Candidatus Liberibacter solanacearum CLso-ZC1]
MASLKELKNRIHSVKETQKITEAMQLVSVTKLRRAKEAIQNASLYQSHIRDFFIKCAVDEFSLEDLSPLIRGTGRSEVYLFIVCTAEKGLCGGFNSQIIRFARERIRQVIADNKQVKILIIGRKGHEGLYKEFSSMIIDSVELPSKKEIDFAQAHNIAQKVVSLFTSNVFDVCFCIHSEFKSIIQQIPIISKIIPVDFVRNYKDKKEENLSIYHYEPTVYSVLEKILFQSISAQIFWALLENKASEIGARITAMDNATRNAGRMVEHLILSYNRQRQMRITTDLIEIIAGAEAV